MTAQDPAWDPAPHAWGPPAIEGVIHDLSDRSGNLLRGIPAVPSVLSAFPSVASSSSRKSAAQQVQSLGVTYNSDSPPPPPRLNHGRTCWTQLMLASPNSPNSPYPCSGELLQHPATALASCSFKRSSVTNAGHRCIITPTPNCSTRGQKHCPPLQAPHHNPATARRARNRLRG